MNNVALKPFIATRLLGAQKLVAALGAGSTREQRARARAALDLLSELKAESFTDDNSLQSAASAAQVRRDSAKRFSPEWHAADAEHDVFVALHHDLFPSPEEDDGEGSNRAPKAEEAAAGA